MDNMFYEKMCAYCKNEKCSKKIEIEKNNDCVIYRCNEYIKDESKIVPYTKPLLVTAKRDYVTNRES